MPDSQTPDGTTEPAVTRVLHALTDRLHESLCNCKKYPTECVSRSLYRRDELVHTLTYAEDALDVAIEQGWTPPAEIAQLREEKHREWVLRCEVAIRANRAEQAYQQALAERDTQRMSADRAYAELYRVRDALGARPGGADLGLQVRDAVAQRDAAVAEASKDRAVVAVLRAELGRVRTEYVAIGVTVDHVTDRLSDMVDDAGLARPESLADALDSVYTLIGQAPGEEQD